MRINSGFTLIELVVVIVILGILAVTAAPKFLNLQDDARYATLKGLTGTINSALPITYSKAAVNNKEHEPSATVDNLTLQYGYPVATKNSLAQVIDGLDDPNWNILSESPDCSMDCVVISTKDNTLESMDLEKTCHVIYVAAKETIPAKAYLMGSDCDGLSYNDLIAISGNS